MRRDERDERATIVSLTDEGWALRDRAVSVPGELAHCIQLDPADATELYRLLHVLLGALENKCGGTSPQ